MYYIVTEMHGKVTSSGYSYRLSMDSYCPDYQATIMAVTKEQFDTVKVGDKIEVSIAPSIEFANEVAARVVLAETAETEVSNA